MIDAGSRQAMFPFAPGVRVRQIISGGQTGVDRAALDVAIELGISHGGFCPLGRRSEDGRIPERYALEETASERYPVRTEQNVLLADGTLILFRDELRGGTRLTYELARRHEKPCFKLDLNKVRSDLSPVRRWLARQEIQTLNIAGPRESQSPGIYLQAREWLTRLLTTSSNKQRDLVG
jgi:hypothetical protein